METDDLASPELPEKLEMDDTEEKVRSGEGHEEIAGVGDIDGEGEESLAGGDVKCNPSWSTIVRYFFELRRYGDGNRVKD